MYGLLGNGGFCSLKVMGQKYDFKSKLMISFFRFEDEIWVNVVILDEFKGYLM